MYAVIIKTREDVLFEDREIGEVNKQDGGATPRVRHGGDNVAGVRASPRHLTLRLCFCFKQISSVISRCFNTPHICNNGDLQYVYVRKYHVMLFRRLKLG